MEDNKGIKKYNDIHEGYPIKDRIVLSIEHTQYNDWVAPYNNFERVLKDDIVKSITRVLNISITSQIEKGRFIILIEVIVHCSSLLGGEARDTQG